MGQLSASSDPAAACATTIAELQNPEINTRLVSNIFVIKGAESYPRMLLSFCFRLYSRCSQRLFQKGSRTRYLLDEFSLFILRRSDARPRVRKRMVPTFHRLRRVSLSSH
jgi:hypothetical protein